MTLNLVASVPWRRGMRGYLAGGMALALGSIVTSPLHAQPGPPQVVLPERAGDRAGLQPVVHLAADGGERTEVAAGETVTYTARIEVPEGTGEVVDVEWDFGGVGEFVPGELEEVAPGVAEARVEHAFDEPGTYFTGLRATSHRTGDRETEFARVQNLGRVRVVVE